MPKQAVFFVRAALIHLLIGMTFGALMLANKGFPFEPSLWRLLPPHIDLVLIGWTLQFVMGVALWILPRHTAAPKYGRAAFGWAAFVLLNISVVIVAIASWTGSIALLVIGRSLQIVAVFLFAVQALPRVRAFMVVAQSSTGVHS